MGWKTDTVLIRPGPDGEDDEALLQDLGFSDLKPVGEASVEFALWPDDGMVWIGAVNDCLWISARDLTGGFFKPSPTGAARLVLDRFPAADVAALILHSVVNLWGFAVYRAGVAVRRKAGSSDDGVTVDFGPPLPEEAELLANSRLGADGRRLYRLPDFPGREWGEDQVGEEFVFRMFDRFLGLRPDRGDALFETPCRGYSFAAMQPPAARTRRRWWRFW